jgi:hypothetical protein
VTSTGYLALPLCLLALWLPRGWSIPAILIAASAFADAAIANPAGRPIQVGWFVALLVSARVIWSIGVGRSRLRLDVLGRLAPLALFIWASVISLLLALAFFQGKISVLPGSAGLNPLFEQPYRLTAENVNQLVYLGLIFAFVYALSHLAAGLGRAELTAWIDRGMRWSCGLAAIIVAWHIAQFTSGIWFPGDFFHSSVHAGAWQQGLAEVHRPSGPFAEPSALGYFYTMYMFYFWQRWRESGSMVNEFFFYLSAITLLLSTSTTAYLMLAVFAAFALFDKLVDWWCFRRPGPAACAEPIRIRGSHLVSALALLALVSGGLWFVDRNRETVDAAIEQQIRSKGESDSYEVRTNADRMAWRIFLDTYGLGAGLGSHRSSSGLLALLAGTGLIGTLAFTWLMAVVTQGPPAGIEDIEAGKALRWAVLGLLGSQVVAGPDLQSLPLWTCSGLIIGMRLAPRALPAAPSLVSMTPGRAPSSRLSRFEPDRLRVGRRPTRSDRSDAA